MRLSGMSSQQVAEKLGIQDIGRLRVWVRKFRKEGEFGFVDQRGRRKKYVDQERYVEKLELENDVLKKWLEILNREGRRRSIK